MDRFKKEELTVLNVMKMVIFGPVLAGQAMDMMVSTFLSPKRVIGLVKYYSQRFVRIYALEVKKETGFS